MHGGHNKGKPHFANACHGGWDGDVAQAAAVLENCLDATSGHDSLELSLGPWRAGGKREGSD